MKKKLFAILSLVLAFAMLVGCAPAATQEPAAEAAPAAPQDLAAAQGATTVEATEELTVKDSLVTTFTADAGTLNPFELNNAAMKRQARPILETMTAYDAEGNLELVLLEKYEYNEDATAITFYLKKGVKFHNGEELVAEDVIYTLNGYLNGNTKSDVSPFDVPNCVAVDDYTVYCPLKAPNATVHDFVKTIQIVNKEFMESGVDTKTNMVGTGPYVLDEYVAGDHMTYHAFEEYHGGAPKNKTLVQRIISEASVAMVELENGNVDVVFYPLATDIERVVRGDVEGFQVATGPTNALYMAVFNNSKEILSNLKVRQAIWHATNRDDIVIGAFDQFCLPCYSPIPQGGIGASEKWKNTNPYPYDVEKAKSLLAEAGYPNGFELTLMVDNNSHFAQIADLMINQLAKVGITVKLASYDTATVTSILQTSDEWDIVLRSYNYNGIALSSLNLYGIADNAYLGGTNFCRNIDDPIAHEYQALLEEVVTKSDEAEALAVYEKIEDKLIENVWYMPLVAKCGVALCSENVEGVFTSGTHVYINTATAYEPTK